ncbi:MAG: ABC transporter substrate-binding protein [Deltaproteobacteria bacterium]|nr:ABC transporter substrate-binding protein [Deltaproteobacteria bacterium]
MASKMVKQVKSPCRILIVALGIVLPSMVSAQLETVKLGDLAAISNAAVYIAIEKGLFKEQGVFTDITNFASAAKQVPALVAGELEVSVGSASAGLFNAVAQQAPFRIVADKGQARADFGFSLLTVRKDLVDSGQVKTFKDLKGKKIAILAKGNIQHYLVGKMAEEVGLTINDVDLTFLGAPNQVTAFETKAIDAAYAVEPWPARFAERGVAVRFRTPDQVKGLGPVQVGVIIYSGKFIKERRPVAQRWMNAYLKAAELFHKNGTKDPEIAAILEKYTKVPAKVIQTAIPPYQEPNGKPLVESLADQAQWFARNGMQQKISIENALDLSFLK